MIRDFVQEIHAQSLMDISGQVQSAVPMDDQFLSKIEELKDQKLAVATITTTFGSTLGKPGFKMIRTEKGEIFYGTLGGGCP